MKTNAKKLLRRSWLSNVRRFGALTAEGVQVGYQHGLLEMGRWMRHKIWIRRFEWKLGVDTTGNVQWHEMGDDPANGEYAPIDWSCFDRGMRQIEIREGEDVFLDYGCGKGRAVLLAGMRPFRKVIGVERATQLYDIAQENVNTAKSKLKCQDVQIVHADATCYEVHEEVTVIFLYNPFSGHVLKAVVDRIHQSYLRNPRKLTVIYVYPQTWEDVFAECHWLVQKCELPTGYLGNQKLVIHESQVDLAQ